MFEFKKSILIALYAAIGLYLLYRILIKKSSFEEEYENLYNKILNSKEYKVKGQFEAEK